MSIDGINLHPKTRRVQARDVLPGNVVMEKAGWPCLVRRVARTTTITLWVVYTWQERNAREWALGPFSPTQILRKAVR